MPHRRVVIDHMTIGVSDLRASRRFYGAALAPLGFAELTTSSDDPHEVAFGPDDLDDFAISTPYPPTAGGHVAFAADSRDQVDTFYDAAIAAGATDNGRPGIRTEYSPGYYGAFVLDPDGYNIEAVHHEPR
jgi:catechol 2,3-dioxygenase-like lactoylglutathione lyase family enzyme